MRSSACCASNQAREPAAAPRGCPALTAAGGLQEGERVSVVACPETSQTLRKQGLLTSRPPSTKPGEPLEVVNHDLGTRTVLVRPTSKAASALPKWLPYAAGLFLAADVGSGFMDANLPTLIAGGAAVAGASFVGGNQFLVPRLKQLPENSVRRPAPAQLQNRRCGAGCAAHAATHAAQWHTHCLHRTQ